jgi:hypothetical protein
VKGIINQAGELGIDVHVIALRKPPLTDSSPENPRPPAPE